MYMTLIPVLKPISTAHGEELGKRVFFISADIEDFKIITENNLITGIEVKTPFEVDIEKLTEKVNNVIANEIAVQLIQPAKVVWKSQTQRNDFEQDLFDRMIEKDMAYEVAEGQVCFGEPVISLMDALDDKFRQIAVDKLGGNEYRYPTLIPTKVLEDCGYFNSFPHMLMFVTRLHNDIDVYKSFYSEYQEKGHIGSYAFNYFKNVDYCLPPTMCYHTYNHLRDRELGKDKNMVITSKGKSFRYESKYCRTVERLWDFTIREIVFMGNKDFVIDCRQRFMEEAFRFADSIGLMGHCEVASDPFFCSPDSAAKIFNQKMLQLKYEFRLNIEKDRTIAAASFNFHDQFFGEHFNIRQHADEHIRTGCIGFGIERFAYAFLSQHGLEPKNWPKFSDKL